VFEPAVLVTALETSLSWVVPTNFPLALQAALGCLILLVLIRLYQRIRRADSGKISAVGSASNGRYVRWIIALFVPCYLVVVLVSKAFLDRGIPIDFRLLAPVHMALVALVALCGDDLAARYRLPLRFWILAFGVLAALLTSKCVAAARFAADAGENGLEFSVLERKSQLLAIVRRLPVEAEVYSNIPRMSSYLADRPVWPLTRAVDSEGAYVAYYNYKWGLPVDGLPPEQYARARLSTIRIVRDGGLYQIKRR
jgi:hypothetical protein